MPAEQRVHSFCGAVIRYVFESDARRFGRKRDRVLAGRAQRGPDDDLTRAFFCILDQFLESPMKYAPGTRMAFAGVIDASDRKALILYLESQK